MEKVLGSIPSFSIVEHPWVFDPFVSISCINLFMHQKVLVREGAHPRCPNHNPALRMRGMCIGTRLAMYGDSEYLTLCVETAWKLGQVRVALRALPLIDLLPTKQCIRLKC